jgi:hypothetical protein
VQHEASRIRFWIATHNHDFFAELSESGHSVLTRRRLADATLTVNCNLSHVCFLGFTCTTRVVWSRVEFRQYDAILSNNGANGSQRHVAAQNPISTPHSTRVNNTVDTFLYRTRDFGTELFCGVAQ